jgi:hypothetical protein
MWEKKSDDGGLHDHDGTYAWSSETGTQDTVWDWLEDVNAEGGGGFAGHGDWRIPNAKELASIVDYEHVDPAVDPIFNAGCAPGCTVLTCSCTAAFHYWTSTSSVGSPLFAWVVVSAGRWIPTRDQLPLRAGGARPDVTRVHDAGRFLTRDHSRPDPSVGAAARAKRFSVPTVLVESTTEPRGIRPATSTPARWRSPRWGSRSTSACAASRAGRWKS